MKRENLRTEGRLTVLMFLAALFLIVFTGPALAEERVNGILKSIDLKTNTAVVVSYEGAEIPIAVEDEVTLAKLRDRRIRIDDDVKVRYEKVGGKNVSTYFRRLLGCF